MALRVLRERALDKRRVRARRPEEASGWVQALRRDGCPRRAQLVQIRATEVEVGWNDPWLVLRDQGRVLRPSSLRLLGEPAWIARRRCAPNCRSGRLRSPCRAAPSGIMGVMTAKWDLVYELRADGERVRHLQETIARDHDFSTLPYPFGSDAWWNAIDSGSIECHRIEGTITDAKPTRLPDRQDFHMVTPDGSDLAGVRHGDPTRYVEGLYVRFDYVCLKCADAHRVGCKCRGGHRRLDRAQPQAHALRPLGFATLSVADRLRPREAITVDRVVLRCAPIVHHVGVATWWEPRSGVERQDLVRSFVILGLLAVASVSCSSSAHSSAVATATTTGSATSSTTSTLYKCRGCNLPRPVVLGRSTGRSQRGYGTVQPSAIDNGGDPTGIVEGVRWQSWGEDRAFGVGTSSYEPPGKMVADSIPEQATVVAFDLGSCNGVRSYNAVTWYFPQHGEKFDPRVYRNTCTGVYVGDHA